MDLKPLYIIFALVLAACNVSSQNEDELQIPDEVDNQFPPRQPELEGLIEGSGDGIIDEPIIDSTTESTSIPKLENVEEPQAPTTDSNHIELPCPKPCVCHTEGITASYVVDCSGYGLTEFPTPIDPRTSVLNLNNNKLTEIPKTISDLKNLKVVNANNNLIMELALGSVSELPELVTLKLGNNRLIEYPRDLKNGLSFTKLEELDLGGNDMRTALTPETFFNFNALRKITLPASPSELALDLCGSLKDTLETVCTESCEAKTFECPDAPPNIDEDLLDATTSSIVPSNNTLLQEDLQEKSETLDTEDASATTTSTPYSIATTDLSEDSVIGKDLFNATLPGMIPLNTEILDEKKDEAELPEISENEKKLAAAKVAKESITANEFSLRTAVNNAPEENIAPLNVIAVTSTDTSAQPDLKISAETPKEASSQPDVKVGAKTTDTKQSGGVNKNVIGIVVTGMIVVVAVITIKKNWSSIRKRFSSTPNRAADRTGTNANGTTPEEVPLQDKSDKSPV